MEHTPHAARASSRVQGRWVTGGGGRGAGRTSSVGEHEPWGSARCVVIGSPGGECGEGVGRAVPRRVVQGADRVGAGVVGRERRRRVALRVLVGVAGQLRGVGGRLGEEGRQQSGVGRVVLRSAPPGARGALAHHAPALPAPGAGGCRRGQRPGSSRHHQQQQLKQLKHARRRHLHHVRAAAMRVRCWHPRGHERAAAAACPFSGTPSWSSSCSATRTQETAGNSGTQSPSSPPPPPAQRYSEGSP